MTTSIGPSLQKKLAQLCRCWNNMFRLDDRVKSGPTHRT